VCAPVFDGNYQIKTYKTQFHTLYAVGTHHTYIYHNLTQRTGSNFRKNCLVQCDYKLTHINILYYTIIIKYTIFELTLNYNIHLYFLNINHTHLFKSIIYLLFFHILFLTINISFNKAYDLKYSFIYKYSAV